MPDLPEPVDTERGNEANDGLPPRQRSVLPSFLFISFVLFMITNNQGEELQARSQYLDALTTISQQIANYSAWLNGTATQNFTLVSPCQLEEMHCWTLTKIVSQFKILLLCHWLTTL